MTKIATLFLDIEVYDEEALRKAAAAQAEEDGIDPEDWEEMRHGLGDDLQMLLDPGSIPGAGFSIVSSSCEVTRY